jgi:hypothetical protein
LLQVISLCSLQYFHLDTYRLELAEGTAIFADYRLCKLRDRGLYRCEHVHDGSLFFMPLRAASHRTSVLSVLAMYYGQVL